jgi:uncharacterized protein
VHVTKRLIDGNGWMFIPKNPISKAGVFPYLGSEIAGAPEPNRIYNVFRPPEELEKAAETFKLLPIIDEHELLGESGTSTDDRPPAGFTGEKVTYEHPYLFAPLKITSPKLMAEIRGGKSELSPAYFTEYEPCEGVYEGQQYQYIQHIRAGNHLALVERGRTGADVAVLDHQAFTFDTGGLLPMNLEELLTAVAELSDEEKAQLLAALTPASDEEKIEEKTEDETPTEVEDAAAAETAKAEGDNTAAVEASEEAVQNAEEVLAATEELRDKIAEDSMKKAIRHIDERNRMLARVKPFIGAVPVVAQDSAESIASYFLKKKGVKFAKGQAAAVTMGYLHDRKPVSETVAQDSKPVTQDETINALWGTK